MPSARTILSRAGLALGGVLAGLVLAEGLARVLAPVGAADLLFESPDGRPDGLYVCDQELVTRTTPGFSGEARFLNRTVPVRTNALGLRGSEPGPEPRWLVTGDSFTFAIQVAEEDSFVGRLDASRPESFLNAGVDGDSTWQALGRYERVADELELEGVVLTFFMGNDFSDNREFEVWQSRTCLDGEALPGNAKPSDWDRFLLRTSYLAAHYYVWTNTRYLEQGTHPSTERWARELSLFTDDGGGELRALLPKTRTALEQLKAATDARGDRLIVALAPPAIQIDQDRAASAFELMGLATGTESLDAPEKKLTAMLDELGIEHCSLLRPLRRVGSGAYYTFDGHWTPAGHEAVAEQIGACMDGN